MAPPPADPHPTRTLHAVGGEDDKVFVVAVPAADTVLTGDAEGKLQLVATLEGQRRDEPQHIARMLQRGELTVGAVAAAAHGPGDEGSSGHRRSEDDRGETSAVTERTVANMYQSVW